MGLKVQEPPVGSDEARCFAGNLAWLLYRAHWALAAELAAAFEPLDVSARGYHVLRAALSGEHTQTELAAMVGLDKTTMVVTVDELERAGLAERRLAPQDRRARIVSVTAAGKRRVAEAEKVKERVQAEVLGELSAREGEALMDALSKLVEGRLGEQVECTPPLRRRAPRA
ncbi:MAG: winged helix-turn-helix transcriptional regulator [Actinobacteria bacterium]|nr:MAG: winged helix-turn-helix transcriptional regulator [Actinomycetota bacterium]